MSTPHPITLQLLARAEPKYRDFAASLIRGPVALLGVRLPILRRLARRLALDPEAWRSFIASTTTQSWMEEIMICGMLPGYIRGLPLSERVGQIRHFIPLITNWSICDSCCSTYRFIRQHRDELFPWLLACASSDQEYQARLGIVCLMQHYLQAPEWAPAVAQSLPRMRAKGHDAVMAAAWCCCELHLRYPRLAAPLLDASGGLLPLEIQRKTRQKIRESRRSRHA